jgi:hypothetical protein
MDRGSCWILSTMGPFSDQHSSILTVHGPITDRRSTTASGSVLEISGEAVLPCCCV